MCLLLGVVAGREGFHLFCFLAWHGLEVTPVWEKGHSELEKRPEELPKGLEMRPSRRKVGKQRPSHLSKPSQKPRHRKHGKQKPSLLPRWAFNIF